jgi:hypothetical protein
MIDVLASTVVANFLLPYANKLVDKVTEKVAEAVGDQAGKSVAGITKKVWDRVKAVFGSHPDRAKEFERFEKNPADMAGSVKLTLRDLLESDPSLATDLQALVDTPVGPRNQSVAEVIGNSGISVVVQGNNTLGTNATIGGIVYSRPPSSDGDRKSS